MKQFNTYLFDFDGTLVDTYESLTYVFGVSFAVVGIKVKESDVAKLMRCPLEEGYKMMKAPDDERSYRRYGEMIVKALDDEHTLKLSQTYEEVREVLNYLRMKGKKLGIVTSNSKKHVLDVLRYIGIDKEMFDVVIGNAEAEKRKPNPEPVLKALELLGVSKEETCYVGDALDDVRCGIAAGVFPILVDRYNEYENEHYNNIKTLDELIK